MSAAIGWLRTHPRRVASALAVFRILNGSLLLCKPGWAARLYLGPGGREPTGRLLSRFIGARDVITGFGALLAVRTRSGDVEIVGAAATVEAVDAVISLRSPGVTWRLRGLSVTAVVAAALGAMSARGLAAERRAGSAAS